MHPEGGEELKKFIKYYRRDIIGEAKDKQLDGAKRSKFSELEEYLTILLNEWYNNTGDRIHSIILLSLGFRWHLHTKERYQIKIENLKKNHRRKYNETKERIQIPEEIQEQHRTIPQEKIEFIQNWIKYCEITDQPNHREGEPDAQFLLDYYDERK